MTTREKEGEDRHGFQNENLHWWSLSFAREIFSLVEFLFMKKRKSERITVLGMKKLVRITDNGFAPTGRRSLPWETAITGVWFLLWGGKQRTWSLTFCFLFHFQSCSTSFVIKPVTFFCYEVLPWQICSRTRPLISLKAEKLTANTCSSTGSEAISLSSSLS